TLLRFAHLYRRNGLHRMGNGPRFLVREYLRLYGLEIGHKAKFLLIERKVFLVRESEFFHRLTELFFGIVGKLARFLYLCERFREFGIEKIREGTLYGRDLV